MNVLGLERVTYGVEDMAEAVRFWTDFGLTKVKDTPTEAVFETEEKSQIAVKPMTDPSLPKAPNDGPTVREIVWGCDTQASVDALAAELRKDREVRVGADGAIYSVDEGGHAIGFTVSKRVPVKAQDLAYNTPGAPGRINERGPIYKEVHPPHMSHIVLLAPEIEKQHAFYQDRLGFKLTDIYPGRGVFMRASKSHDHHTLFLLKAGEERGFHHLAFELRNIHEVFGGGLNMTRKGWKTHIGPGRHPISSCYFWYFKNPCGGAAEYDSDSDYVTDEWQAKEWETLPENFAEWAYAEGAVPFEGVQGGRIAQE